MTGWDMTSESHSDIWPDAHSVGSNTERNVGKTQGCSKKKIVRKIEGILWCVIENARSLLRK